MGNRTERGLARIHIAHPGGYLQCTSYLIGGPDGAVLVDPGSGALQHELVANIEAIGCGLGQIRAVLLTHCHVDHALGAYRLRRAGVPLVSSPLTSDILRVGSHQVWYEYPEYVIPTEVDRTVGDQEELDVCGLSIRVLHTPGHTCDSASYLVETAGGLTALTGDLISDRGQPGWAGSEGFSTEISMQSIRMLIDAAPAKALWGHGVVEQSAVSWLNSALELGRIGEWQLKVERHPEDRPPGSFGKAPRHG